MALSLHTFNFRALGSANQLQFYSEDRVHAGSIAEAVINDIQLVEKIYSRYLPDSIITKINNSAAKEPVEVDIETAALIDYAETCYRESAGLFDLTSGVLRKAWDFKSDKLPIQEKIDQILPLIGWDKVEWKKPFIKLKLTGMEIDFGGIGKEFASDRACGILQKHNVRHGLVNLGGDIRIVGPHPNNQPWSIGIVHPRKNDQAIASLQLTHGAIATSGDYEKFIEIDGIRYCHLLNPKTGWPLNDTFQSVSVVSDSCLVSGSISTITMLLGERNGLKYLKQLDIPYLVVRSDGTVLSENAIHV